MDILYCKVVKEDFTYIHYHLNTIIYIDIIYFFDYSKTFTSSNNNKENDIPQQHADSDTGNPTAVGSDNGSDSLTLDDNYVVWMFNQFDTQPRSDNSNETAVSW